jgi:hypothetical protein
MTVTILPAEEPQKLGFSIQALQRLEAAIGDGIARQRFPGAVSLIARRGRRVP